MDNSEDKSKESNQALEMAWQHYAELDANALELTRRHLTLRRWVAGLGILATLFAILTDTFSGSLTATAQLVMKFFFVITPIAGSVLAAFINKFYGGGSWLVMRAGAENILKEIYLYRTILQNSPGRRTWMYGRLATIRRQVYKGLGGELALKLYKGKLPPYYSPEKPDSDPGYSELNGDDYLRYRLDPQLEWHSKKANQFQAERMRLQLLILAMGGAGALLAAFGGPLAVWVALTAAIASALIGWEELRNLDVTVRNYSKVILELDILRDYWMHLSPVERTSNAFYTMVKDCEEIQWSQNMEYIRAMQEALAGAQEEGADLINQVLKKSLEESKRLQSGIAEVVVTEFAEQASAVTNEAIENYQQSMGTLFEEAASPIVAAELEAMQAAMEESFSEAAYSIGQTMTAVRESLTDQVNRISEEFSAVEITAETPAQTLHQKISSYPVSGEIKG